MTYGLILSPRPIGNRLSAALAITTAVAAAAKPKATAQHGRPAFRSVEGRGDSER